MVSGLLLEPAMRTASNPEYDAGNWAVSSPLACCCHHSRCVGSDGGDGRHVESRTAGTGSRSWRCRRQQGAALAFAASWLCSLPHAYLAMPHFRGAAALIYRGSRGICRRQCCRIFCRLRNRPGPFPAKSGWRNQGCTRRRRARQRRLCSDGSRCAPSAGNDASRETALPRSVRRVSDLGAVCAWRVIPAEACARHRPRDRASGWQVRQSGCRPPDRAVRIRSSAVPVQAHPIDLLLLGIGGEEAERLALSGLVAIQASAR